MIRLSLKRPNYFISSAAITKLKDNGQKAQIKTCEGEILSDVLMLYPYGDCSNILSEDSSLALVFFSLGSKTNAFAIPYNVLLQPSDLVQWGKIHGLVQY